jgi:hypothetical protein
MVYQDVVITIEIHDEMIAAFAEEEGLRRRVIDPVKNIPANLTRMIMLLSEQVVKGIEATGKDAQRSKMKLISTTEFFRTSSIHCTT